MTDGACWRAPSLGIVSLVPSGMKYRMTLHTVADRHVDQTAQSPVHLAGREEGVSAPNLCEALCIAC